MAGMHIFHIPVAPSKRAPLRADHDRDHVFHASDSRFAVRTDLWFCGDSARGVGRQAVADCANDIMMSALMWMSVLESFVRSEFGTLRACNQGLAISAGVVTLKVHHCAVDGV